MSAQAAEYTGPLFDAHLHYNDEAWPRSPARTPARRARTHVAQRRAIVAKLTAQRRYARAGRSPRGCAAGVTVVPRPPSTATGTTTVVGSATSIYAMVSPNSTAARRPAPYRGLARVPTLYDSANARLK